VPTSTTLPASHAALLTAPGFGHLATVQADGRPRSHVMWFDWDGTTLRFTHTVTRGKYRDLGEHPGVAFSVIDPQDPYRFVEVQGTATVRPDPGAAFCLALQERYGVTFPVGDPGHRVVVEVAPERFYTKG
jgi:PPOX class probable F420-dependent enzyme